MGRIDDDEIGQHVCDIGPHVQLCRRFPVYVLGPVDAVERQGDYRRVYRIDAPSLEPGERTAVADVPESGRRRAEPVAQRPVEPLRHDRIPRPVRVGERIPLRRRNAADPRELRAVDLGDVHELVEAEGVQKLPEHQRVELRGVRELPRLDPVPAGNALDQMAGQPLDNLGKNGYHSPRCLGVLFHSTVHYRTGNASKATLLYGKNDATDGRIGGVPHVLRRRVYGMLVVAAIPTASSEMQ